MTSHLGNWNRLDKPIFGVFLSSINCLYGRIISAQNYEELQRKIWKLRCIGWFWESFTHTPKFKHTFQTNNKVRYIQEERSTVRNTAAGTSSQIENQNSRESTNFPKKKFRSKTYSVVQVRVRNPYLHLDFEKYPVPYPHQNLRALFVRSLSVLDKIKFIPFSVRTPYFEKWNWPSPVPIPVPTITFWARNPYPVQ